MRELSPTATNNQRPGREKPDRARGASALTLEALFISTGVTGADRLEPDDRPTFRPLLVV
jgi:hypothetical protein